MLMTAIAATCAMPLTVARAGNALPSDRHKQVDAIFAPWTGRTTPGCAIGVSSDGVMDYARGYGMSNLEYDVPITPQSIFNAASISKQFTAFAIELLAQQGKLSLGDDVRKYLPELPDYGATITLAHLLHHTSGLREQAQVLYLAGWRGDDLKTQADMLWITARQRELNFEPGTEVGYTNTGYMLLATIVERVSGRSFRAFTNERIFQPLGMTDTRFEDDHREVVPRRASAYRPRDGGGWRISVPVFNHYGSTNLLTTVGDLLKWAQNLSDARVGGRTPISSLQTSGKLNDGTAIGYGGGLRVADYRGLRTVSHDGSDGGYGSDAILFPDQRLAIAVLCNNATIAPAELTREVADVYLRDRLSTATLPPAVKMPEAELAALAGVYWSPLSDEVIRMEWKDGTLRQVGVPTAFVPIGHGAFRPGESTHRWQFFMPAANAPADAQPELRIRDFWPTQRVFTRVSAPLPTASALASFAGRYHSDEADMVYSVRVANGRLILQWPRQTDVALEAVGGDRFVGPLGTVTFTHNASREVDGLTISNRRLRRFRAERLAAKTAAPDAAAIKSLSPEP